MGVQTGQRVGWPTDGICGFCLGQIANYKIPGHVWFVTEFPGTMSGKIQKYKVQEFEIETRGLQRVAGTATA